MAEKAKFIKASKALQRKAGTGDVAPAKLARAEAAIVQNTQDFSPLADALMIELYRSIEAARRGGESKTLIAGMVKPVMELKANARMFRYDLVTSLANIVLDFLESVENLDNTVIDIIDAHHKTLSLIFSKKMSGDGGSMGPMLQKELQNVIARYQAQK